VITRVPLHCPHCGASLEHMVAWCPVCSELIDWTEPDPPLNPATTAGVPLPPKQPLDAIARIYSPETAEQLERVLDEAALRRVAVASRT
jgi:hypothetical protein